MAKSVLLIILSLYVAEYQSSPFYDYPRQYNGLADIPRLFRDMFLGRHRRPEFHRDEIPNMPPFDPQLVNGMTPVLIPINNLGYPEQVPQYNMDDQNRRYDNQAPYQNRISGLFKRSDEPSSSTELNMGEDLSDSLPVHPSTTTSLTDVESTTATSEMPVTDQSQNSEDGSSVIVNNVPEKEDKPSNSEEGDAKVNNDPKLEKQSLENNQDPNPIVFPDTFEKYKNDLANKSKKPSEYPNRFTDSPEILYAVNIGPSLSTQYEAQAISPPSTNAGIRQPQNTQTVPYTNNPGYNNQNIQYTGRPTYVTYQNPAPAYTNNVVSSAYPNTIALPNSNGGTSLYTVITLPMTSGNTYYPSQTYQPSNVLSNPGNYQTLPSGYQSPSSYYNMVTPNQNTQTSYPSYYPQTYKVGYVSSNGQTVLVPSNSQIIQMGPQANYVPLVNGQTSLPTQTSAPNVYLPDNTNTVSLISFKDKAVEKPKEENRSVESDKEPL